MRSVATYIRALTGWNGDAALYRMDPPHEGHEYVVASAVDLYWGILAGSLKGEPTCETYLFPATADGEVVDYIEMDGSLKHVKDHAAAFAAAGYAVHHDPEDA